MKNKLHSFTPNSMMLKLHNMFVKKFGQCPICKILKNEKKEA